MGMYLCYTYMFMWVVPVCIRLGEPMPFSIALPIFTCSDRASHSSWSSVIQADRELSLLSPLSSAGLQTCATWPTLPMGTGDWNPHGYLLSWAISLAPLFGANWWDIVWGSPQNKKKAKDLFFPLPYPLFLSKTVTLVLSMSNRFCSIWYSPEGK